MSETSRPTPTVPIPLAYYCLIPHPAARQLLFLACGEEWTLPWWMHEGDDRPFWQTVDVVDRALRVRFGLDTPTLRCVHVAHDSQQGWIERVYECEPAPLTWTVSPGGHWFGQDDVERLLLAIPAHRALLDRWFAEAGDAAVARRPPGITPAGTPRRLTGSRPN